VMPMSIWLLAFFRKEFAWLLPRQWD